MPPLCKGGLKAPSERELPMESGEGEGVVFLSKKTFSVIMNRLLTNGQKICTIAQKLVK